MSIYLVNLKIGVLEKRIEEMASTLTRMESRMTKEEVLWDNADLIKNWKVSPRTIADWRSKKLISYTQIGGKIYYTPEDRQRFLDFNHVNCTENER